MEIIQYIKDYSIKPGLAIKPNTPADKIYKFLPCIHLILVMTVEPGRGGQELIPKTLNKINEIKEYITKNNLDLYIEADGGINLNTIENVSNAGIDIAVSGVAIINSENYKETIKKLKNF